MFGIKWNPLKDVQQFAKQAEKEVSNLGKSAEKGVQDIGKNIEKNYQNFGTTLGSIAGGNFNNLGQSLLNMGLSLTGVVNPNDVAGISGETGAKRMEREAMTAVANQEKEAAKAKEQARLDGLAAMLSGAAKARSRMPGFGQTLLGSAPGMALLSAKE